MLSMHSRQHGRIFMAVAGLMFATVLPGNGASSANSASADSSAGAAPGTADKLTQSGITWAFDTPVQYGKFAGGDYWVLGPVTIKEVSPSWNGTCNGSMIDPTVSDAQGYRKQWGPLSPEFADNLRAKFPLILTGTHSLVSTIGLDRPVRTHEGLDTVAILTVVDKVPPKDAFRPPYLAGDKPVYSVSQLRWNRLPTLAIPTVPPPYHLELPDFDTMLQRVGLDHVDEYPKNYTLHARHGHERLAGIDMRDMANLSLLVLLDIPERRELVGRMVQLGIDLYPIALTNGDVWSHEDRGIGCKWPILFAGIMLGNDKMQALPETVESTAFSGGGTIGKFTEDGYSYYGKPTAEYPKGEPLFGCIVSPKYYAKKLKAGHGDAGARDPKGLRDAIDLREAYTASWVGEALAARLMGAQTVWNHPALFDYVDRWVEEGGDPTKQAKRNGAERTQYCYGNFFIKTMWDTYRSQADKIAEGLGADRTAQR